MIAPQVSMSFLPKKLYVRVLKIGNPTLATWKVHPRSV
jgi:hypothetical protein